MATRLYTCGYNFSSIEYMNVQVQPFTGNPIAIVYVQFEALYSDLDVKFSDVLYHVSLKSLFNKVNKNGLIPKSSSVEFEYPDRLYLFNQVPIETVIEYAVTKAKTAKTHEICIYCISSDKLKNYKLFKNGKLKFYRDPAFSLSQQETDQTAIFTYGIIPRSLLENRLLYIEFTSDYSVKQTKRLTM